ncbi:hypothetical protein GF402_10985 [Candidatus Fermentibacteria bacterium]|nr:hypothetical protein [Candidatus Fermentibacteria bacterium]
MTVVLDYDSGRVVWMGLGRRTETLEAFFAGMTQSQRESIEAEDQVFFSFFVNVPQYLK